MHEYQQNPEQEEKLNPPPRVFRVSLTTKVLFICFSLVGVLFYSLNIQKRRSTEHDFVIKNQVAHHAATKDFLPEFSVADIGSNQSIPIHSIFKKWTLLNIWATWCPPCREEMPSLELLHKKLFDKLNVVALSVDQDVDSVKEFIKDNKPSFTILWDAHQEASQKLELSKYPETFLINPEGKIIAQMSGPRDWAHPAVLQFLQQSIR